MPLSCPETSATEGREKDAARTVERYRQGHDDRRVSDDGVGRYTAPELPPDDPVEVGRYLDAFRRSRWLIAGIVVFVTAAVFVISLLLPKTYQATSKLVLNPSA